MAVVRLIALLLLAAIALLLAIVTADDEAPRRLRAGTCKEQYSVII